LSSNSFMDDGSMALSKRRVRRIASERVKLLFKMAEETISVDPELAQRYASIARELEMHCKVKRPAEYRHTICKHCKKLIIPGANCRVRLQRHREPHVVITCQNCGGHMRIPIRRLKC